MRGSHVARWHGEPAILPPIVVPLPAHAPLAVPTSLDRARTLTRLLDSAAHVPGTRVRFGLDSILGLVPGLGDVAGAALSGYLVLVASRMGAPQSVIARMLANVAIDTVGGTVPVLGDLFDVAWKSNTRNLALLERVAGESPAARTEPPASRTGVALVLGALLLLAIAGVVLAILFVKWLSQQW